MDVMIATDTRVCPKCEVEFPRTQEFFGKGQRVDGMHSWCLSCRRGYIRAADPERNRERARRWGRNNQERNRSRAREWRNTFPERKAESDRRWNEANRERAAQNRRAWRERNRQRWLVIHAVTQNNRRTRLAKNGGAATTRQVLDRIAYFGGRCWMCSAPWECLDHVIPIALGGTGWASNLRPACNSCNASKGAKPHKEVMPFL